MKALFSAILLALLAMPPVLAAEPPAKELFGSATGPAPPPAAVFGSYAKGCLAGAVALPRGGEGYQTMRPSRNRGWGHPDLIRVIERLARDLRGQGWPGILVGDMAQPRGGPMRTGHTSHQIGLDADIWLTPMPAHTLSDPERESIGAVSMLRPGTREADPDLLGAAQLAMIRTAALQPEVERIFVHPGIKQNLCATAGANRAWLGKVRPWWGHDAHFHIRLRCPDGQPACRPQEPPPPGDGCGAELAWWLSDEPWQPSDEPPPPPLRLDELPAQCRTVLEAP